MLSRLAATSRVGAHALRVVRPARQLHTGARAVVLYRHEEAKWDEPYVPYDTSFKSVTETTYTVPQPPTILEEWNKFAGQSAAIMALTAGTLTMFSKEWYVIQDEFSLVVMFTYVCYFICSRAGPTLMAAGEKARQEQIKAVNQVKDLNIYQIKRDLEEGDIMKEYLDTRNVLHQAALEYNQMELEMQSKEHEYEVEKEVKNRLDYQIDLQKLNEGIEYSHMAKWIEKAVVDSITPQMQEDAIRKCIADIEGLAEAQHA